VCRYATNRTQRQSVSPTSEKFLENQFPSLEPVFAETHYYFYWVYLLTVRLVHSGRHKTVLEFVRHRKKLGQKLCLLTLDTAGAFDNAGHTGILARLWKLKCPPNIYNIVRDFLSDRAAHVTLGNSSSSKRVTKGCSQGSSIWSDLMERYYQRPNSATFQRTKPKDSCFCR
jgi:hypothetical protein